MSHPKHEVFTQHSRHWRDNLYVYPVISRRSKGLSVGINLNPDKLCNFGCVYCSVDRESPPRTREVDLDVLAEELDRMLALAASAEIWQSQPISAAPPELRRLNDLAFSGDGEPTSYPRFGEACRIAADSLNKHSLTDVKIVVITNATLLHRPAVAQALEFLDAHNGEIWAKLDAGTEQYYRYVERTSIPLSRVIENIAAAGRIRPIVIQSLFMRLQETPPCDNEIGAYIKRLSELQAGGCQIKLVQIYTVARKSAEAFVSPLPDAQLDEIAAKVRSLKLNVETYYGPA